ncbi:zinc finger protein OZF-like isoform X1 [Penaeus indicus]|uniref:zinc finger protein OZF-like isoform X1 n=2 Tax=Penaeus indicus TaxID=29960 RepID=UPI00300D7140
MLSPPFVSSQMATVGGELVGGELGVVLEETGVGVTFVDPPSLESSSLTEDALHNDLTVCQYILPHDVTVAGFEEVVEEVELGSPSWDNLNKSSSSSSLSHDSGISADPSPDVFFTLIEETVAPSGLLTASPGQEGGEVIVERIYEMKDDLCFTESAPEIKDEPLETVEHCVELESGEQVVEHEEPWPKRRKSQDDAEDECEASEVETKKGSRVRVVAYHCSDCSVNFTDESEFRAHMEAHLIKLQNSCALCSTEFPTKSELQDHIKEHFSKNSSHTCNICEQKFVSKSGLKRHKKQLHNFGSVVVLNTAVKCGVCQAVFSDKAALRQHAASHATRKPFTCEECGATFTQNGSLQVHLRRHRGEKPFTCQLCGNSFTRAHSLKVHMKTHTGEKPYACEYCGACFVTSSHLTVHRRTHTGERPYSCSDCGATFITTSHLNVHRRVHTGGGNNTGTPVSCPQCQATFNDPAQLRHHRRTQHRVTHQQSMQVTCKVCDKRFSNHSQLGKHMVHECG